MNKSFYYDVNENKWKSVRGHNCPGAVWVDDATEDEIRVHLAKIPEIIKAQAEIAALRAENIRLLVRCDEKFDIIDNKNELKRVSDNGKMPEACRIYWLYGCKKCHIDCNKQRWLSSPVNRARMAAKMRILRKAVVR